MKKIKLFFVGLFLLFVSCGDANLYQINKDGYDLIAISSDARIQGTPLVLDFLKSTLFNAEHYDVKGSVVATLSDGKIIHEHGVLGTAKETCIGTIELVRKDGSNLFNMILDFNESDKDVCQSLSGEFEFELFSNSEAEYRIKD